MAKFKRDTWYSLNKLPSIDVPNKPGAYVIAVRDTIIYRAIGHDKSGVLDIGEAKDLADRLKKFRACAVGRRKKGHSAGVRFFQLNLGLEFPVDKLRFKAFPTESKGEAYKLEGKLLNEYLQKHKEQPPLNYQANKGGIAP